MDQNVLRAMFSLIRSAITKKPLSSAEKEAFSSIEISNLIHLSRAQDLLHLVALGLKENGLLPEKEKSVLQKSILHAAFRYERLEFAAKAVAETFEKEKIPYLPLKGAVLKDYYPEPWMRTSCDADILIHPEDLPSATRVLTEALSYQKGERTTHDIPFSTPTGEHIEIHFDLVEENRARLAIEVLKDVWLDAAPSTPGSYRYQMSDSFFYFYHIAHMAKHFENGGCGVRPLLDLYLLDQNADAKKEARDALLAKGNLLQFAEKARDLSSVWFGSAEPSKTSLLMQDFIFKGGLYGTFENRVALSREKEGGKTGYLFRRIFVPAEKLRRYYPILEKMPYLLPLMQVRRWGMLLNPKILKMAKSEIKSNFSLEQEKAERMKSFLNEIGL